MWNLLIIEYDNFIDNETGNSKQVEIARYVIDDIVILTDFLRNIKKNVKTHPEFFCQVCGFWISYKLALVDKINKIVCLKGLFYLFLEKEEESLDFDNLSLQQLEQLLTSGLT